MPWVIAKKDGEYCVYKQGADGEPTGKSLGCHDTRKEAEAQLAALYANEPEAGRKGRMNVLQRLVDGLRALARSLEEPPAEERAVSLGQVWTQLDSAVWEMDALEGGYPWLMDLYFEEEQIVALLSAGGKLYRAPVMIDGTTATLGTLQEVQIEFAPIRSGQVRVIRQADGRYRWFAVAETAVLNRVGEIDSRDMFDGWVEQVEAGARPRLRFFHDDRLDFGEVDHLARENAVLIASGTFDEESPLTAAFIDACEKGRGVWGTSVGFVPTAEPELWQVAEGVTVPVYHASTLREISLLPEASAASWFTAISAEVTRMRKEELDALKTLFGDEARALEFAEEVDEKNRTIAEQGLITRGEGAAEPEEPETTEPDAEPEPETDAEPAAPRDYELPEEVLDAVAERVRAALDPLMAQVRADLEARCSELAARIDGLPQPPDLAPVQETLNEVGRRLEALERDEDEKRREWQADLPAKPAVRVTWRPRENADGQRGPSKADIAAATLANMPARRAKE